MTPSPDLAAACPQTLSDLILHARRQWPTRVALRAPGRPPGTYTDLADQAACMAGRLAELGLRRGDRLAVVLPDGPELASAFLTLAAFVAVAPLNPAYRTAELDFYLSDLGARAVVLPAGLDCPARAVAIQRGLPVLELSVPPGSAAGRFDLGRADDPPSSGTMIAPQQPASVAPASADEALLLHTSGTTSRPKLVPLSHLNLCTSGRNIAATLALTPEDRCLCVMPLFHIHGLVGALLSSISAGASVICSPGFAAEGFFDWLGEFQPTWYSAVPTMHQAILERAVGLDPERVRSAPLRLIRSSSAALPPTVMKRLEDAFAVPVIESYGMTEAAHQMASNPLPPRARKPGSVGPSAGPEIAILDEQGQPVAAGVNGEVCIRGANVTAGYDHHPEANATAFTAQGWFRTGDQGHLDPEGYLFLTGRLKEIINRGGEKIGPREIDDVLLQHPQVRQAVAFGVRHPTLGEDLAAAVVATEPPPSEEELRIFLLERLPAFKVPTRIMLVAEIPKGPTGKIQRIGLADRLASQLAVAFEAPLDGLESEIAPTFREILGLERIGRHDNFFSIGGDSIRATRIASRLSLQLGVALAVPTLFRHPTLARVAVELARSKEEAERELDALAESLAQLPPEEAAKWLHGNSPG